MLSVNVAGLRAVLNNPVKLARFTALVAAERPDLLCLNEHKLKEADVDEATASKRRAAFDLIASCFGTRLSDPCSTHNPAPFNSHPAPGALMMAASDAGRVTCMTCVWWSCARPHAVARPPLRRHCVALHCGRLARPLSS